MGAGLRLALPTKFYRLMAQSGNTKQSGGLRVVVRQFHLMALGKLLAQQALAIYAASPAAQDSTSRSAVDSPLTSSIWSLSYPLCLSSWPSTHARHPGLLRLC